ncbi:MAG: hypothetical protein C4523_02505 [Myxococcales bacterium]|nr:MAG: hypothetical protein C4523_02505 [Myxococcales bacterium]
MAWVVYPNWIKLQHNGSAVDLDLASNLAMFFLTSAYTPNNGDGTWVNVTAAMVASGASYAPNVGKSITSPTITLATTQGVTTFDCADVTVTADAGGFTNARYAIIGVSAATTANRRLICYADLGADKTIVGGDLVIQMAASGVFEVS